MNAPTDTGSGSGSTGDLRYVLGQANANPNPDGSVIQFDPTVFSSPQTITLSSTLTLSETAGPEVIRGPGASLVTISGQDAVGVFQVNGGVTATLAGLTIADGRATAGAGIDNAGTLTLADCTLSSDSVITGGGGGIANSGTMMLTGCTLSGDSAFTGGGDNVGGGISNTGMMTLADCTLSSDSAVNGGGGIDNAGTLTLANCTLSGDSGMFGGGIDNVGTVSLAGCTFSGNSALDGAGINVSAGTLTLANCTLNGGSAAGGGGICNRGGNVTVTGCTISGGSAGGGTTLSAFGGGGIFNLSGTLMLTDCTVSGNTAGAGGGIENEATMTLTDCTISGNAAVSPTNSAGGMGGGIENYPVTETPSTLTGCTVSDNTAVIGGGISNLFSTLLPGTLALTDCTVSDNSAGTGGGINTYAGTLSLTDCTLGGNSAGTGGGLSNLDLPPLPVPLGIQQPFPVGTVTTVMSLFDNPVDGNLALAPGTTFISQGHNLFSDTPEAALAPTDLVNADPLLGSLADNGGPTMTMALLPGSPAIDAGVAVPGVTTDQRGVPRPQGAAPDIGAFESRGFTLTILSGNDQVTPSLIAFSPLVVVVASPFGEPVAGGRIFFEIPDDRRVRQPHGQSRGDRREWPGRRRCHGQ